MGSIDLSNREGVDLRLLLLIETVSSSKMPNILLDASDSYNNKIVIDNVNCSKFAVDNIVFVLFLFVVVVYSNS